MSGYIGNIPVPQATQTRDTFTATAGQTTFATSGYTPSFLDVYLNGVHLVNGTDYTATNGSDVVLTSGAAAGDTLEVVAYSTFEVNSQTFTGTTTLTGDLQATTATFSGAVTGTDATLSGGVYLGGTGSANYLDDYETGTWTPVIADDDVVGNTGTYSSGNNTYVKIGNVVHLFFEVNNVNTSGMTTGNDFYIRNLPFTSHSTNGTNYYGNVRTSVVSWQTDANLSLQLNNNDSHFRIVESRNGNTADFILVSQVSSGNGDIHGTLTYETDL